MRLPFGQEKAYRGAEDEPGHREPDGRLETVCGDDVQDDHWPECEAHHATGSEETDAQGCVRRL